MKKFNFKIKSLINIKPNYNKTITLVFTCIIFAGCLFCGLFGLVLTLQGYIEKKPVLGNNPDKEFRYNNKLYFYNEGILLGTYECEDFSTCDYADLTIDDSIYNIDYYKDSEKTKLDRIIDGRFAFVSDNNKVVLYNLINEEKTIFEQVKNYGIGIKDNTYIVKSNGAWGVIRISSSVNTIVSFNYDYIGIPNIMEDGLLSSSQYIIKKDDNWNVHDEYGIRLSTPLTNEIVDFNNYVLISKTGDQYYVYNYSSNRLLNTYKNYATIIENYLIVVENNKLSVYDTLGLGTLGQTLDLPVDYSENDNQSFELSLNDNNHLVVKVYNSVGDTNPKSYTY